MNTPKQRWPRENCPYCGGALFGAIASDLSEKPSDVETWWDDGTPLTCDKCGFIAHVSADGEIATLNYDEDNEINIAAYAKMKGII